MTSVQHSFASYTPNETFLYRNEQIKNTIKIQVACSMYFSKLTILNKVIYNICLKFKKIKTTDLTATSNNR